MKIDIKYISVIIVIVIALAWLVYRSAEKVGMAQESFHIAVVGPMAEEGKSFAQGIQLYLDEVNRAGGINGHEIKLDIFDDQNNEKLAEGQAIKIAQENRAIAVIGHYYSNCSIAGGKVYQKHGIPAITPASTTVEVTQDNEWYFRTVFNDHLQGRFTANYLKKVLHQNTVIIIREDKKYGDYLAKVFKETARSLDLTVTNDYEFSVDSENLNEKLKAVVTDLKAKKDDSFIFIAAQAKEGAKIIKYLKNFNVPNKVIVPAAFASKSFKESFRGESKEKLSPGYYTDGIYITTPLIFDTANEKAQQFKDRYKNKYGEVADIRAPFAYDTALIIVEAIKNTQITGSPATLKDDRKRIRDELAKIDNIGDAFEGTTGFNYFDKNRDAQKPVAIGVFKNENIISALVQLQAVRNPEEIPNLARAQEEERVLLIDDKYMYKTNVVYVGIEVNKISDLDIEDLTFTLDFYLWFRYRGDVSPQDIEFSNAIEQIKLPAPIKTETDMTNDMVRHLFRIKDRFKADFIFDRTFKQHVLGINLRHRDLTRNNLIYVTDVIGMGSTRSDSDVLEKLHRDQILDYNTGWQINKILFFQDIVRANSLGSLEYLNVQSGKVEYSQFNAGIFIEHHELTLRRTFSTKWADKIMVFSGIVVMLLLIITSVGTNKNTSTSDSSSNGDENRKYTVFQKIKRFRKTLLFLQTIFTSLLLLSAEVVILDAVAINMKTVRFEPFVKTFDTLWWVMTALLLHLATELSLWAPLEEKSGRKIPRIARRFVAFTIYLMAFFAVIAFVFDQKLTSLLATSGVIAMIIGLAIQINISNIFSGIAINIEHPFRVNDWVKIGNHEEGRVTDVTWRTTRVVTRMGCVLSIPNSIASESAIHNFDYPDSTYWLRFTVHVHPVHPPDRVVKIITDAVLSAEPVVKEHKPYIIFLGLTEWAADYLCYFAVRDYTWRLLHEEAVWRRIWIHLNRAGIAPAIQRQEIHLFRGIKERGEENAMNPLTLLQEIDIFQPFSKEAKEYLSQCMELRRYILPEPEKPVEIVRQGEPGNSLFVIVEGVVAVRIKEMKGGKVTEKESARLGSGSFFGEMALLTGADRSATVVALTDTLVFEITKDHIEGLLANQPEVSEMISKIVAERQKSSHEKTDEKTKVQEDSNHKSLLEQINNWFKK